MDYDPLVKRLGRLSPLDFVKYVYPEGKIEKVVFSDREFELTHRRLDTLYLIKTKKSEEFYLNLEFQGEPTKGFSERLLAYSARILEEFEKPVKIVVIFLKDSKSVREFSCPYTWKLKNEKLIELYYTKIILAKKNWREVLKKKFYGLLPLIPLMNIKKEELKEALQKTVTLIKTIKDEKLRKDLISIFYMIGEDKYNESLMINVIGDKLMEELKESRVYQEIIAEGEEKGEKRAGKELTLRHLRRKFKKVIPKRIVNQLDLITSLDDFDQLLEEVNDEKKDLEAFEKVLEKLVKKATKTKK